MKFNQLTIITRDNCGWCVKAKELMDDYVISYKEFKIPVSLSREEFFVLVEKYDTTSTVPKIFEGNDLIGGYEDLASWIEGHFGGYGKGQI